MALAGIGAGYASWTDSITIDGIVRTGTVDLVIERFSGTWVWKVFDGLEPPANEIHIFRGFVDEKPTDADLEVMFPESTIELISSAVAEQTVDDITGLVVDDAVTMTFDNLFPCIDFTADVLFHYVGSIPVKVNDLLLTSDLPPGIDITKEMFLIDGTLVETGIQLHNCQRIKLVITVHVQQKNELMLESGTITCRLGVIQWNNFVP